MTIGHGNTWTTDYSKFFNIDGDENGFMNAFTHPQTIQTKEKPLTQITENTISSREQGSMDHHDAYNPLYYQHKYSWFNTKISITHEPPEDFDGTLNIKTVLPEDFKLHMTDDDWSTLKSAISSSIKSGNLFCVSAYLTKLCVECPPLAKYAPFVMMLSIPLMLEVYTNYTRPLTRSMLEQLPGTMPKDSAKFDLWVQIAGLATFLPIGMMFPNNPPIRRLMCAQLLCGAASGVLTKCLDEFASQKTQKQQEQILNTHLDTLETLTQKAPNKSTANELVKLTAEIAVMFVICLFRKSAGPACKAMAERFCKQLNSKVVQENLPRIAQWFGTIAVTMPFPLAIHAGEKAQQFFIQLSNSTPSQSDMLSTKEEREELKQFMFPFSFI